MIPTRLLYAVASIGTGALMLSACSDEPETPPTSGFDQPTCAQQLSSFGHGEANYEAAMQDAPTCDDAEGNSVLYYQYLDDKGIKYPGWPN